MRYEVRDIDQSAEITALQDNIVKLEAERDKLRAALEPFARGATALSLAKALGHIEREHLLEARRALGRPNG